MRIRYTSNKSTPQDRAVAGWGDCSCLNDDPNDEDSDVDQDSVFSRQDLSEKAGVHCPKPRTQFEDGYQPSLLGIIPSQSCLILDIAAHVCVN